VVTFVADADTYPVIPARWDRHPHVTHHHLTADGVDADAVLTGGVTLHRQARHIRHRVTRDAHAVLRGVRHLFAHDRHSEEES
jgi:hypothetical protein